MTSASIVLAAALAAWGPVGPPPDATAPGPIAQPATEPGTDAANPAAPADVQPVAPLPGAPAAAPATVSAPIIAKAPVNVRAAPTLVATPERPRAAGGDLHKQWWFWTIAGGCLAVVIAATIIATRPGPAPYTGNAPPYYVPFP